MNGCQYLLNNLQYCCTEHRHTSGLNGWKRTWRAQTNRNKSSGDTETTSGKCHQYKSKARATPWRKCVGDWCSPFTWCFYLCKTPCKTPLFFFFLSFSVLWCHTRWRSGDGKLSNFFFLYVLHEKAGFLFIHFTDLFPSVFWFVLQNSSQIFWPLILLHILQRTTKSSSFPLFLL